MRPWFLFLMGLPVALAGCGHDAPNRVVVPGDGDMTPGDGAHGSCGGLGGSECGPIRAFRISQMSLLDPGIHVRGRCESRDSLTRAFNEALQVSLNEDRRSRSGAQDANDGLIDLGLVITVSPLGAEGRGRGHGAITLSDCNRVGPESPSPNATPCSPALFVLGSRFSVRTEESGVCLGPVEGSVDEVSAVQPVTARNGYCWVSTPFDLFLAPDDAPFLALSATQIAAEQESERTLRGLIRGFVKVADAAVDKVPSDLPFVGGQSLAETLGVDGACDNRDRGLGPTGEDGFWVYLAFEAERVLWKGGPLCGNGVVDQHRPEGPEACDPGDLDGLEHCDALFDCGHASDEPPKALNLGDPCAPRCFDPSN